MKLLATFIAALVMAGYASAGGTISAERTQNIRIRDLERRIFEDEVAIRILQVCDKGDEVCAAAVEQSYSLQEQH